LNAYYCELFSVKVGLELGLDLVSGWLVVMHAYLYNLPLSLPISRKNTRKTLQWLTLELAVL